MSRSTTRVVHKSVIFSKTLSINVVIGAKKAKVNNYINKSTFANILNNLLRTITDRSKVFPKLVALALPGR